MDAASTTPEPTPLLQKVQGFDAVSKVLIAFLTGAVALAGGVLKIGQDQINAELTTAKAEREALAQKINQELELRKAEREDAQQRTAVMLRIFEKAEAAIDTAKDSSKEHAVRERKIRATVLLVNGLTPYVRDPLFVNGIVRVLGEVSTDPASKAEIQSLIEFDAGDAVYYHEPTPPTPPAKSEPLKSSGVVEMLFTTAYAQAPKADLRRYNVDIFFCSVNANAALTRSRQATAKAIFDQVVASGTAGSVRVREMPEIVNMRPGYGVGANEVRYDAGDTKAPDAARSLAALVNRVTAGSTPAFQTRSGTAAPAAGYLSVFVCAR